MHECYEKFYAAFWCDIKLVPFVGCHITVSRAPHLHQFLATHHITVFKVIWKLFTTDTLVLVHHHTEQRRKRNTTTAALTICYLIFSWFVCCFVNFQHGTRLVKCVSLSSFDSDNLRFIHYIKKKKMYIYTQPYKILYYNYLNFALSKSTQLCVPFYMHQMKTNWKLASAEVPSSCCLMLLIRSTISVNPFI